MPTRDCFTVLVVVRGKYHQLRDGKRRAVIPEAIEFLAREAGLPIPVRRAAFSENEAQMFAVESAAEFYTSLPSFFGGATARAYLQKRGS
jgi:hypothetical protein